MTRVGHILGIDPDALAADVVRLMHSVATGTASTEEEAAVAQIRPLVTMQLSTSDDTVVLEEFDDDPDGDESQTAFLGAVAVNLRENSDFATRLSALVGSRFHLEPVALFSLGRGRPDPLNDLSAVTAFTQARRVLSFVGNLVDMWYPDTRHEFSPPDSTVFGSGVLAEGGLNLFFADTTDQDTDEWCLQLTSGLGRSVSDIPAALAWVNERNLVGRTGRYYCVVDSVGSAAVVHEISVWSGLFSQFFADESSATGVVLGRWLGRMVRASVEIAQAGHRQLAASLAGEPFSPDSAGLAELYRATGRPGLVSPRV